MGRTPVGNDVNPLSVLLARPRFDPPAARRGRRSGWTKSPGTPASRRLQNCSPSTVHAPCSAYLRAARLADRARAADRRSGPCRRLDPDGGDQPPDRPFAGLLLRLHAAAEPGGVRSGAAQDQRKARTDPADRDVQKADPEKDRLAAERRRAAAPSAAAADRRAQRRRRRRLPMPRSGWSSPRRRSSTSSNMPSDNWLRNWFAGIDADDVAIAHHRTEAGMAGDGSRDASANLRGSFSPAAIVAFEVGEVRDGKVLLERLVWEAAEGLPFDRLFVMVNQQALHQDGQLLGRRQQRRGHQHQPDRRPSAPMSAQLKPPMQTYLLSR